MIIREAENHKYGDSSDTINALQDSAKENNISIIGGCLPEKGEDDKMHNTYLVFNNKGKFMAKYRGTNPYDGDSSGRADFKEPTAYQRKRFCIFNLEGLRFGIATGYDLASAEFALVMNRANADILVYPSQFIKHTDEFDWKALLRTRAIDNKVIYA